MRAMLLERIGSIAGNPRPLTDHDRPIPKPSPGELLIRVAACGVCHTELDEIEGRLPPPVLPRISGHQAVGQVEAVGPSTDRDWVGPRVGVAWIHRACGHCHACTTGRENLCADFVATGLDVDGGYAEYMIAPADFAYRIPSIFSDVEAAPLLCAGAIGYRSLQLTNLEDGQPLGLTGFGASAHLVLQMARARYPRSRVYVFARSDRERDLRGRSVRSGPVTRPRGRPKRSRPSSTRLRSGSPSSKRSTTSRPAGASSSMRFGRSRAIKPSSSDWITRGTSGARKRSRAWRMSHVPTCAHVSNWLPRFPSGPKSRPIPSRRRTRRSSISRPAGCAARRC